MEDCKKNEKEKDCGGGFDRCIKTSFDYKLMVQVKAFLKGCSTKAACDAEKQLGVCEKAGGTTCKFDCCDSDGCNGSAMPVVSNLIFNEELESVTHSIEETEHVSILDVLIKRSALFHLYLLK